MVNPWGFSHCLVALLSPVKVQRRFRSSPSCTVMVSLPAPGKSPATERGKKTSHYNVMWSSVDVLHEAICQLSFSQGCEGEETCLYGCTDRINSQWLDRSPQSLGRTCTSSLFPPSASTARCSHYMLFHMSQWRIDSIPLNARVLLIWINFCIPYSFLELLNPICNWVGAVNDWQLWEWGFFYTGKVMLQLLRRQDAQTWSGTGYWNAISFTPPSSF